MEQKATKRRKQKGKGGNICAWLHAVVCIFMHELKRLEESSNWPTFHKEIHICIHLKLTFCNCLTWRWILTCIFIKLHRGEFFIYLYFLSWMLELHANYKIGGQIKSLIVNLFKMKVEAGWGSGHEGQHIVLSWP